MENHTLTTSITGQVRGLIAEFIVGVCLATFGEYDPEVSKQTLANTIFTSLHLFIALGLLVGAIGLVVKANRAGQAELVRKAWTGLAAIVTAIIGGVMIMTTDYEKWAILLMSLGFIFALIHYGKWALGSRS